MKIQVMVRYKRKDVTAQAEITDSVRVIYNGTDITAHISQEEIEHIERQAERLTDNYWITDIA